MPTIHRRAFLQRGALLAGGMIPARRAFSAPSALPDFKSLSLEQQVGQLVIARIADWPLMEKYAKQGIVVGMTPSLNSR